MKVQVEELSPIERKLSIEVEGERVAQELDRAYAALNRQVKIAGFRPGKIPRRILESRFRQDVEGDVIKRVVENAYFEAVTKENLEPVSNPQISNGPLAPNAPFSFQARVEVKPKLDAKDYRGLPLKKIEVKVEDAEVEQRLNSLRDRFGRLEPVEGRDVAQPGDYVMVDSEASIDGKEFPGSKQENVTFEVAQGELAEGKVAALEGVKVGEAKELDYVFPQDYAVEEVKGKTAHFKLSVKALKREVKPELNDDFAKETGGGDTLDALKTRIRSDLEKSKRTQAEIDERQEMFKSLIERNAFEVPKAMVERAIDMMLDGALRNMARGGLDPRTLNLDFSKLRDEMRERATTEVKGSLLLEAVALKEGISPSDEELEKKIEQIAGEASTAVSQVRKHFKDPEQRRSLMLRVREEKTIEFLRANASYS